MISKPLLKQSIKANGITWLLVTLATSIMLAIIIIVLGGINSNEIRDSLKTSFIKSELEAQLKKGAIEGFNSVYGTIDELYPVIKETYDNVKQISTQAITSYEQLKALNNPQPKETVINLALARIHDEKEKAFVSLVLNDILTFYETNYKPTDKDISTKINLLVINIIIDGLGEEVTSETRGIIENISNQIIEIYEKEKDLTKENMQVIARIFMENSFYDSLGIENESTKEMLEVFGYDSIYDLLEAYDYNKTSIAALVSSGIIQYTSFINNGIDSETAINEVTKSLFNQMPEKVGSSLKELGEMNINQLMIGTIFYKMAGMLLPIVYTITTANNLIAGQVDSGSMAYVLSTPTKRRKVTFTQMLYLIGSLILMYFIIGAFGMIATMIAKENEFEISYLDLLKLNIGALITIIAIRGICFLASAWFNRSKYSIGIGGGTSMFFLVSTILGLFGSNTMPEAIRIKAMNYFNYTTIISLFDAEKVLNGGNYLPGILILLGIAIVTYTIGIIRFEKKDLPL